MADEKNNTGDLNTQESPTMTPNPGSPEAAEKGCTHDHRPDLRRQAMVCCWCGDAVPFDDLRAHRRSWESMRVQATVLSRSGNYGCTCEDCTMHGKDSDVREG